MTLHSSHHKIIPDMMLLPNRRYQFHDTAFSNNHRYVLKTHFFVHLFQAWIKAANLVIDHAKCFLKSFLELATYCHHFTDTLH